MGTEDERPLSRPPRLEDLLRLCRSLNELEVRYLVIGGFAMILHGYTRGTMDVDLLVDASVENVRKIKQALSGLPDNAAAELDDRDVERHQVVRVADEIIVDLLARACGLEIADALPSALSRTVEGVKIPYPDAATLIRTKETARPKDKQDILFLRKKLEAR